MEIRGQILIREVELDLVDNECVLQKPMPVRVYLSANSVALRMVILGS